MHPTPKARLGDDHHNGEPTSGLASSRGIALLWTPTLQGKAQVAG